jgi:hypothetical protein
MAKARVKTAPPSPQDAPGAPVTLWVAGAGVVAAVGLLQNFLFGGATVDPSALAISFLAVAVLVAVWANLWNRGQALAVPPWRAALGGVAVLAAMLAVRGSASPAVMANGTLALHVLAMFALFLAVSGNDGSAKPAADPVPESPWIWLLAGSAALGFLTVAARGYANTTLKTSAPWDAIFMFFMPRAADYEGIGGGGPPRPDQWAALGIFFALALGGLFYLAVVAKARLGWIVAWLMAAAFLGKLNVSYASAAGLRQIADKISHIGTAYFLLVPKVGANLWDFVHRFNSLQGTLSTHAETHPFGPELFYTWATRLVGYDAHRVGLAVMALTLLTLVPLALAAARYYDDPWAGVAAAALYVFTPQQLILSGAGTDCLLTMGLAWILYFSQRASEPGAWGWGLAAGLAFFTTSIISVGIFLPMSFVGLWILWLCQRQGGRPWMWVPRAVATGATIGLTFAAAHLVLWAATGGDFVYTKVFSAGLPVQLDLLHARPYQIWVWLNPFLIGSYMGWPLVAVLIALGWQGLRRGDSRDGLLTAAVAFGMVVWLTSLGNAEAQRIFQYSVLVALLPATRFFLRQRGADASAAARLNLPLLAAACALLFLNTALLEALVLDYW